MADKLYFDTSAILPYYRNESTSSVVQDFLLEIDPPVQISRLTKVEFASAIARWLRMEELKEAEASSIENAFSDDIKSGLFVVQSISANHFSQAEKWISSKRTSLRTLDALHLACSWSSKAKMITCDIILHQSAKSLGITSRLLEP